MAFLASFWASETVANECEGASAVLVFVPKDPVPWTPVSTGATDEGLGFATWPIVEENTEDDVVCQ